MPSTYTTRNRAEKQAPGENLDSWGSRLNGNTIDMFDQALDGVLSLTVSGSVTLSTANGSSDQARNRMLDIGGTGGTVTIPNLQKTYLVRNVASGDVTFTTGSGTSAVVKSGNVQWVVSTGANAVYGAKMLDFSSDNIVGTGTTQFGSHTRASDGKGYLVGNVSGTAAGTNPIIVVSGTPADTTISGARMCGISKAGTASFLSPFTADAPTWGFYVADGGATATAFIDGGSGSFYSTGNYYVDNLRVVTNRQTGWAAPTGTISRATFDQSTVTLPQLAQRLAALITDLIAHGLIGP